MNSAKQPSSKTSKNTVGVQTVKGMIRLSLPREVSRAAYGVTQKFIFPGLAATPVNLKVMQSKADRMSADIATGNFDTSWKKYELDVVAANKLTSIDGGKKPELSLLEIWEKFKEYKRPNLALTTFKRQWEASFTNLIKNAVNETNKSAIEIRNYIMQKANKQTAKSTLSALELAYNWAIQHKLASENPFLGMAKEINIKRESKKDDDCFNEFEDVIAFTTNEMNTIIEYFENTLTINHWTNYIKFLFYTGCRPGEAAALRWKHISSDCQFIKFSQSFDSQYKITKDTKTGTDRIFPCHKKLKELLLSIKKEEKKPDDLVFTTKEGKQIIKQAFQAVWNGRNKGKAKSAIKTLVEQGKIRQYLKPYATRHTFITHQVNGGIPAHIIAAWVGNSADVIWKHYYQHEHNKTPIEM